MFNGKFEIPELLVISIIVVLVGMIVAGVWLTKKSKQSSTAQISKPSAILIALGVIWCWLIIAGTWGSPLFSCYTLGGVLGFSIGPLLLALCRNLFGKPKGDWNLSARWFFWSMFALTILARQLKAL